MTHPLTQRSPWQIALFRLYLRYLFWRRFSAVRVARQNLPPNIAGRKLIIYTNHPSWWDPALMMLALPRFFPGRRGFGPMNAEELKRYGLFRRMGVFGIDPATPKGARDFLRTALAGLAQPNTALCITAEGAFTDPRTRPIRLRGGLARLARLVPEAVFLPVALEYSFWNESKPEALLQFGQPVHPADQSVAAWQIALESGLAHAMNQLAAASAARQPAAFIKLFSGTAGAGGIYDTWRRLRATLRGQRFSARHQTEKP